MPRNRVQFDPKFFEEILNSEGVSNLCREPAEATLNEARASAPVGKTGNYRDGLELQQDRSSDRVRWRVIGTDWKTLIIESRTGNLARAIRKVTRGR